MEWGWNPDTIVAIATVVAMLAAVAAGFYAARSFGEMRQQSKAVFQQAQESTKQTKAALAQAEAEAVQTRIAQEERERSQAELISAWSEVRDGNSNPDTRELVALVRNASLGSIYDVSFAVSFSTPTKNHIRYLTRMDFLPPGGSKPTVLSCDKPELLQAWEEWIAATRRTINKAPLVEIVFKDAAGQRWMRLADGQLHKCDGARRLPDHWRGKDGRPLRTGQKKVEEETT